MNSFHYLSLIVLLAGAGCDAGPVAQPRSVPQSTPVMTAAKPAQYHYSPFVVQVPQSQMVFDTISFKDVGLRRDHSDPADPMLETIAESVSYQLQQEPMLGVQRSMVEYREEYSDPANHRSCEEHHLYVDVWSGTERWGYSLWSGCGEADNFAKDMVSVEIAPQSTLADRLEPLASAIAAELVQAHQQKCFVKHC